MEELYRRVDRFSMLEDNIRAVIQTVMVINQPTEGNKQFGKKSSKSKKGQSRGQKRSHDQSQKKRELSQAEYLVRKAFTHYSRLARV